MKIELIKNDEGNPIGWSIIPETSEDDNTIATMRDLQFFGMDDTAIEYDGIELKDQALGKVLGNVKCLNYKQAGHLKN